MAKRRRFEIQHQPRFVTFSYHRRLQLVYNDAIKDAFVEELVMCMQRHHFATHVWVVMPEHVHLLLTPDLPDHPISKVFQDRKSRSAGRILRRWYELDAPVLKRLRDKQGKAHFWLAGGGDDRNIYSGQEHEEKLHYIHLNPVERGLVTRREQWRWYAAGAYDQNTFDNPVLITPRSA